MTTRRRVVRHDTTTGATTARPDSLAVEEPLEVRLSGRAFTVTMRTPGHDIDLALGFLVGEGVIGSRDDVTTVRSLDAAVDVVLAPHVPPPDPSLERHVYTSSACGVCGSASLEAVDKVARFDVSSDPVRVTPALLASCRTGCARGRRSSRPPAASTRPASSLPTAAAWSSGRTSAVTTPSTRWWAGRSARGWCR
jgi:FdhD protein